jgi:hypothetical protein
MAEVASRLTSCVPEHRERVSVSGAVVERIREQLVAGRGILKTAKATPRRDRNRASNQTGNGHCGGVNAASLRPPKNTLPFRQRWSHTRMERSSASVGPGILRCRSGFDIEVPGMGWLNPARVPIRRRSHRSLSGGDFQSLSVRLWSIPRPRWCSPALAAPKLPNSARRTASSPFSLTRLHRVRVRLAA